MWRCRSASTRRSPASCARNAAVSPTVAATEKFLARLGTAFPGTVSVGGCKNWYTSQQPTPVLWPFPQSEHKAFFEQVPRKTCTKPSQDRETKIVHFPAVI